MTLTSVYGGAPIPDPAGVHSGKNFVAAFTNLAVSDDGVVELLVQTGLTPVSLVLVASLTGSFEFNFFEDPTVSDAGAAVINRCRRRLLPLTATATVTSGPTTSFDGLKLVQTILPGGERAAAVGSFTASPFGWDLKKSSTYLLRLRNDSGAVAAATLAVATLDLGASYCPSLSTGAEQVALS